MGTIRYVKHQQLIRIYQGLSNANAILHLGVRLCHDWAAAAAANNRKKYAASRW